MERIVAAGATLIGQQKSLTTFVQVVGFEEPFRPTCQALHQGLSHSHWCKDPTSGFVEVVRLLGFLFAIAMMFSPSGNRDPGGGGSADVRRTDEDARLVYCGLGALRRYYHEDLCQEV